MDAEKEIQALSAETLAFSIILGCVLSKLATDHKLRFTITEAFNEAADVAHSVAVQFGKSASPEHSRYRYAPRPLHPRKVHQGANDRPETGKEYFERYPKDRYLTEVESWRHLQSANIEFTMKRLREPIEG